MYNKESQAKLILQSQPLNIIVISQSSLEMSFDCPEIIFVNKNSLIFL